MSRTVLVIACLLLAWPLAVAASESTRTELEQLLHDFMAGASVNDAAVHDRFWAEELVYTSSSGARFDKAHIMQSLAEAGASDAPLVTYRAEAIDTRLYGDMAVIAFQLVGEGPDEVARYWNTGTFRRFDGRWQAVAWQATRIPQTD
jgi:hypothetical protein